MKLIYLHQYFATPDSCSGTRSYEMSRRLVKDGHDVTVLTTSAFLDNIYNFDSGWNFLSIDGISVYVLKLPYSNSNSYLTRIYKFIYFSFRSFLKSLNFDCDVIFATSTPLTIIIPAFLHKKIKKIPLVFEVRDLWPELPIAVGAIKNPFVIWAAEYLEMLAYKSSSKIITLSSGMKNGVLKKIKEKNSVVIIPNSCDNDFFNVSDEVGLKYKKDHLKFVKSSKLVVYAGTLGVINDVSYLVYVAKESFLKGYDICFYVVGDGAEKEQVRSLAEKLKVLNINFFMSNPVNKKEVVKILSAADMALSLFGDIPEMWSNSANKMFDALAAGKPVGINYKGWQYDLINEKGFGICLSAKDYVAAAKKIHTFLFDDRRYSNAKYQSCDIASKEFSRDNLYVEFEKTIKSAVSEHVK